MFPRQRVGRSLEAGEEAGSRLSPVSTCCVVKVNLEADLEETCECMDHISRDAGLEGLKVGVSDLLFLLPDGKMGCCMPSCSSSNSSSLAGEKNSRSSSSSNSSLLTGGAEYGLSNALDVTRLASCSG